METGISNSDQNHNHANRGGGGAVGTLLPQSAFEEDYEDENMANDDEEEEEDETRDDDDVDTDEDIESQVQPDFAPLDSRSSARQQRRSHQQ